METYVNSAGKTLTAAQIEQEYRKQLIVAGRPLEGAEYDTGLRDWLATYKPRSKLGIPEQIALWIGCGLTAIAAILGLVLGGILGFILTCIVGMVLTFGFAGIVMMFTTPAKKVG